MHYRPTLATHLAHSHIQTVKHYSDLQTLIEKFNSFIRESYFHLSNILFCLAKLGLPLANGLNATVVHQKVIFIMKVTHRKGNTSFIEQWIKDVMQRYLS